MDLMILFLMVSSLKNILAVLIFAAVVSNFVIADVSISALMSVVTTVANNSIMCFLMSLVSPLIVVRCVC